MTQSNGAAANRGEAAINTYWQERKDRIDHQFDAAVALMADLLHAASYLPFDSLPGDGDGPEYLLQRTWGLYVGQVRANGRYPNGDIPKDEKDDDSWNVDPQELRRQAFEIDDTITLDAR